MTHTIFESFIHPSSSRIDELEHRKSLRCPPCIATVSHKNFCSGNPQLQSPCEQASIAPRRLCTV